MDDATRTTDWPYDARRDDPLTALRIPVVGSYYPSWCYIAALCIDTSELQAWGGQRPTDAESAMLASFIQEYIHHWYNDSFKAKLAERPFDIDGGANGVTFVKHGPDDWGYRRRTWDRGPMVVPVPPRLREHYAKEGTKHLGQLDLAALLDRIHTIVDEPMSHWVEWKAAHPEVFEQAAGVGR